jgi:hypothetical protein
MAANDSTEKLTSETMRQGALACMAALRDIETIAEMATHTPELTMEEYWQEQKAVVDILLKAAGATSPYISGFLAVFAEYVGFISGPGIPDLDAWIPHAAMTEAEFAAHRQRMESDLTA